MRLVPEMFGVFCDEAARNSDDLLNSDLLEIPNSPVASPPSLHDLFDVEVDPPADPNEDAVNSMFPECLFEAADEGSDSGGESGQGEELDLKCYEECIPSSDSETEQTGGDGCAEPTEKNELILDCPEHPGHGCRACAFHRDASGNPETLCALCYLRLTGNFVYSK
ncbi:E1A [simian adenovirus 53]|uniref:Early E1A protein n=1 Tax=simian adenovirus 53 TaxID=1574629 RepID=A0A0A1ERQ0_9ADEN|nr:E1A [Rhesus adenovirus 53]